MAKLIKLIVDKVEKTSLVISGAVLLQQWSCHDNLADKRQRDAWGIQLMRESKAFSTSPVESP